MHIIRFRHLTLLAMLCAGTAGAKPRAVDTFLKKVEWLQSKCLGENMSNACPNQVRSARRSYGELAAVERLRPDVIIALGTVSRVEAALGEEEQAAQEEKAIEAAAHALARRCNDLLRPHWETLDTLTTLRDRGSLGMTDTHLTDLRSQLDGLAPLQAACAGECASSKAGTSAEAFERACPVATERAHIFSKAVREANEREGRRLVEFLESRVELIERGMVSNTRTRDDYERMLTEQLAERRKVTEALGETFDGASFEPARGLIRRYGDALAALEKKDNLPAARGKLPAGTEAAATRWASEHQLQFVAARVFDADWVIARSHAGVPVAREQRVSVIVAEPGRKGICRGYAGVLSQAFDGTGYNVAPAVRASKDQWLVSRCP